MTERQGALPDELINGSEHFWLWTDDTAVACEATDGRWKVPGFHALRSTTEMQIEGWFYACPAPSEDEARQSVADARRLRWLLKRHSETEALHDSPGVWLHDIGWAREARTADIRAAIDDAMKETGDG